MYCIGFIVLYLFKVLNRRMRDMHVQVHVQTLRETRGVVVERQCRLKPLKPL